MTRVQVSTNNREDRNAQHIDRACKALQLLLLNAMQDGDYHGELGVIVTVNSGAVTRFRKLSDQSEKMN